MTKDYKRLQDRYFNDPQFYTLVNVLTQQIEQLNFTPSEIRDAAMFAAIRFELFNAKPVIRVGGILEEEI